jgi:flavin reductase (DIM6/NTAB) family NADH-FMN oxidoreductase RutF
MQSFTGTDAEAFLGLARFWASAVTIVTVLRPPDQVKAGHPPRDGFTATAFLTVSLHPPLILVSASNETSAAQMLRHSPHFAVNLLAQEQVSLASNFALPHPERADLWAHFRWKPDQNGVPVLLDSIGAFSAQRSQLVDAGDHTLVLGHVTEIHRGAEQEALIYANRVYGSVRPL